jgi:hypothetical protein
MFGFIESANFSKHVNHYMNEEGLSDFQAYLCTEPFAGDLIPSSGGLRKIRWRGKGHGKRGGLRVIYYNRLNNGQIWLLAIHAKNEFATFTDAELKLIRRGIPND